jgi:hypothetical protein
MTLPPVDVPAAKTATGLENVIPPRVERLK